MSGYRNAPADWGPVALPRKSDTGQDATHRHQFSYMRLAAAPFCVMAFAGCIGAKVTRVFAVAEPAPASAWGLFGAVCVVGAVTLGFGIVAEMRARRALVKELAANSDPALLTASAGILVHTNAPGELRYPIKSAVQAFLLQYETRTPALLFKTEDGAALLQISCHELPEERWRAEASIPVDELLIIQPVELPLNEFTSLAALVSDAQTKEAK